MPARQPGNDIDKLPRWHTGSQAAPTFLALSTYLLYPLVQQKLNWFTISWLLKSTVQSSSFKSHHLHSLIWDLIFPLKNSFGWSSVDISHQVQIRTLVSLLRVDSRSTPAWLPACQLGSLAIDLDKLHRWYTGSQAAPTILPLFIHSLYPLV
jgi:hypothetical protein